jgi:GNAT superfamily N-acetyltransferase
MMVHPAKQSQGIGRALMKPVREKASAIQFFICFFKADDAQAALALEPLALSTTSELNVGVPFVSSFYVVR